MATLLDSIVVVTNIDGVIFLNKGDRLCEVYLFAIIHEWIGGWLQRLRITIIDITTQNAEVTDIALQTEQLGKLRCNNDVTTC